MNPEARPGLALSLLSKAWPGWLWSVTLLLLPWMQQQQFAQGLALLQVNLFLLLLAALLLLLAHRSQPQQAKLWLLQLLALMLSFIALWLQAMLFLMPLMSVAALLELWRHWLPSQLPKN